MIQIGATIKAIGTYVPDNKIENIYFEDTINTSDKWIESRTGIKSRFFISPNEHTSDMCVKAVENLIKNYKISIMDVDFIIVATSTPDQYLPSVASQVQYRLKIPKAGTMDLSAACAGFMYGLIVAKGLIATGSYKKILVIGADCLSSKLNFMDRTTCILFGDGAGAVLVEYNEENNIFHPVSGTNGFFGKDLYIAHQNAQLSDHKVIYDGFLHQNGQTIFKWAIQNLQASIKELINANNISLSQIDALIPHSANLRILDTVCDELGLSRKICLESIVNYGNTSAASIPLAWYDAVKNGILNIGDRVISVGFGGGLTYAGLYFKNQIPPPLN